MMRPVTAKCTLSKETDERGHYHDRHLSLPRCSGPGRSGRAERPFCLRAPACFTRDDEGMLVAFSISPLGTGDSVSAEVAEAVRLVRESGLPNETNAMFTNVEGEWDEVMPLLKRCMEKVAETSPRVGLVIKIDYRPGARGAMRSKVESVEERLRT